MTDMKALAQQGVQAAQTSTAVVKQNDSADKIAAMFQQLMPKLAQASLAKLPPEFIVSTAMTLVRNNDQIREADPLSVVHCVVQSAQTGLRLDPVLQQAALVVRYNSQRKRKEAQFMPMYRGLLLLSRRSGKIVHVAAQPVYDCDTFSYEYGSDQKLIHKPSLTRSKDAKLLYYYAYIKLAGGGFQFEVMTQAEIDEIKAFALKDKKNVDASPWTTDPIPMSLKTVLRRCLKLAPVEDPMLMAAIQADEMIERGIPQEHVVQDGLVVPSSSSYDAEAEAAAKAADDAEAKLASDQAAAVDTKKEPVPAVDTRPTPTWFDTAKAGLAACIKKGDKVKSQEWGAEARKRRDKNEITQTQFNELANMYRAGFPPAPAPEPGLFDGGGNLTAPAGEKPVQTPPEPAAAPSTGEPAAKAAKKPRKKVVAKAEELFAAVSDAKKLSVLFTLKGRIEKAGLDEKEKAELLKQLDAKLAEVKGAKKA